MKKFFKKLFTIAINRAAEENLDAPPKTRVRPFTKTSNPYYLPEFFYEGKWIPFTKNLMGYNSLRLWENRRKNIFADFEEAISFCKQWKSLKEILDNRELLDKEYEQEVRNFKKQIDAEQKTWYSE